jgi:hypothetical protein
VSLGRAGSSGGLVFLESGQRAGLITIRMS